MALPNLLPARRTRRASALVLGLGAALAACASAGEPAAPAAESLSTSRTSPAAVGDTVRIVVGQAVSFDGGLASVGFEALVADSRCPANALCVRLGEAAVRLRITARGQVIVPVLYTDEARRRVTHAGYVLELVNVEPYPGTVADNVRIAPSVIVRVTRR